MSYSLTSLAERAQRAGLLLSLLALVAGPPLVLVLKGLTTPLELIAHLATTVIPHQLGLGLAVAFGATIVATVVAAPGLACGLFEFPGRALLHRLLLMPLLLPAWYLTLVARETTGKDGYIPLVLCLGVAAAPLVHLGGTAALRAIPRAYVDLLRTLGRARPYQLARALLPLALPSTLIAGVLVFLQAWADVASARNMAVPTLAAGMLDQWSAREDSHVGALLGLLTCAVGIAPPLVVLVASRRLRWHDDARLVGSTALRRPLRGIWALAPWLGSLPVLGAGVLYPWAVVGSWAYARVARVPLSTLGTDTFHSFLLSILGSLIALALALLVLRSLAFSPRSLLSKGLVLSLMAAFAMPSTTLAVSVLWTTALLPAQLAAWVVGTALPMVFALGLRYAAVFLATGQSALVRQASSHVVLLRLQGRTDLSSFVSLLRPLFGRPMLAAMAFVLLEGIKELSLPLILQPFSYPTLASRVFQFAQTQRTRDCSVWMLCMALLGLFPLFELARIGDTPANPDSR